ncbi:hypothetical protein HA464_03200 [Rhizobium leguminosarum bv. trifolii]|uniref:hypothetical protein n=1 Tax=Rhizobium ruizarguesonis TaxID=2081791 RepID=UPI0010317689|nr:hypothetical protein [Rhizobium ruizarguesonis]QIO43085.1 hypothetical protein HA464_03200 [Rhizobium leguminosarum bv. trifolii]TAZ19515.1 hypothetical protein ELH77_12420 [Rhizobium ruizarguesonis]
MMTAFVAELVRAANETDKVSPLEVTRMLHRAIVSIRDLRESLGIPGSGTATDDVIVLFDVATDAERLGAAEHAAALLKAADMLRTLHVATSEDTRIWIYEQTPLT